MTNMKSLCELSQNKRLRYLIMDLGVGIVISMGLYNFHSEMIDKEEKKNEK